MMRILTINYSFTQHFEFPAEQAYDWCTNYSSQDLELMHENGSRNIQRISKDVVLLRDSFLNGKKKIGMCLGLARFLCPKSLF